MDFKDFKKRCCFHEFKQDYINDEIVKSICYHLKNVVEEYHSWTDCKEEKCPLLK